jgi:hypothetical protein
VKVERSAACYTFHDCCELLYFYFFVAKLSWSLLASVACLWNEMFRTWLSFENYGVLVDRKRTDYDSYSVWLLSFLVVSIRASRANLDDGRSGSTWACPYGIATIRAALQAHDPGAEVHKIKQNMMHY